jgi:hypothetical protein
MTFPQNGRRQKARRRVGEQRRDAASVNSEVLPHGNVGVNVIVQADQPLFDQHHQGDRSDRLGHRVDAEDRILAHRLVAFDVHTAAHAGMCEMALTIDVGQRARQIAAVDIAALDHFVQPCQSRRRHAYRFGLHSVSASRG